MNELLGRIFSFEKTMFPDSSELYGKLANDGQSPTIVAALARGKMALHGRFVALREGHPLSAALPSQLRMAAEFSKAEAAE